MRTRKGRLATMCRIKVKLLSRQREMSAVSFFSNKTAKMMRERRQREREADPGESPRKAKARTHVPLLQGEPYQTYLRWLFGAWADFSSVGRYSCLGSCHSPAPWSIPVWKDDLTTLCIYTLPLVPSDYKLLYKTFDVKRRLHYYQHTFQVST